MSASITLSPSVRQNLLSLQNTASLMLATQNRLATGKKVNSALDNASSFFTASALNNRANALNSVIDSVSNGIQIFAAANNGLTGITHLLESMQAVLNQTGQSQTNQTASYGIGSVNTSSVQNMSFSGGSVGASPVQVALNTIDVATPASAATVTSSADYVAPTAASGPLATTGVDFAPLDISSGNETYAFTVSKNGGAAVNVQLGVADGSVGTIWPDEAVTGINADLTAGGSTIRARRVPGSSAWGKLQFYDTDAANTGTAATISVSDVTTGGTTPGGILGWEGAPLSGQGADAVNRVVTIGNGTTTATATLTSANAATAAAARTAIQAAIDATALVGTITVGGSANRINLAGLADGSNSLTVGGAKVDDVFGAGRTVTPGSIASTGSIPPVVTSVAASADYVAPTALSGPIVATGSNWLALGTPNGNETYSFTVSKNSGPAVNVQLTTADGVGFAIGGWQAIAAINADLTAGGSSIQIRSNGNPMILGEFYDTDLANTGSAATITVSDVTAGGTAPSGHFGWEGAPLLGQGANAVNRVVTVSDGTTTATATLTAANAATAAAARVAIQAAINGTALVGKATVGGSANRIDLAGLADGSNSLTVGGADVNSVFGAGRTVTPGSIASGGSGVVKSVSQLVSDLNNNAALSGKVHASNAGGKLSIENISGNVLTVTGVTGGNIDGSGTTATIAGASTGSVSGSLITQFNGLRTQLDKLAGDSYFNGVNLLNGDNLNTVFNEQGSSSLSVTGVTLNSAGLGLTAPLDQNSNVDTQLAALTAALATVRMQAVRLGSYMAVLQTREDFTKNLVNTLQTGSNNLVLADPNQEGSNLLALQTRQSLSTTALSLASQSDQAVLRLFG